MGSWEAFAVNSWNMHVSSSYLFSKLGDKFGKVAPQWLLSCKIILGAWNWLKHFVHGNEASGASNVAFGMVLLQGINGPQCTGQPMWLPCQKWHPQWFAPCWVFTWLPVTGCHARVLTACTLLGSQWLEASSCRCLTHMCSAMVAAMSHLAMESWMAALLVWGGPVRSQVGPPLPPYLPLRGKPCFQPSGTGWKKRSFQWAWILWHKVFPMAGGSKECSGILSLAWVWSHGCGWKLVGGAHMFYWETITTCIHGKHLPQGLFTMIWCMCDLCQKVFVGLWCYQHTIDKISLWCKFPIAAVMMGWVSVCMFKAWNGCGW